MSCEACDPPQNTQLSLLQRMKNANVSNHYTTVRDINNAINVPSLNCVTPQSEPALYNNS